MPTRLTSKQLREAIRLRNQKQPVGWKRIGAHLGITGFAVQYALDPAFRAATLKRNAEIKSQFQGMDYKKFLSPEQKIERNPIYDPRRDEAMEWDSVTAFVFGDPPVGRRAIDIRGAA